jgi:hypothetical protein
MHHRDRAESVTGVDDKSRGAIVHEARLRLGIDLAAREEIEIAR